MDIIELITHPGTVITALAFSGCALGYRLSGGDKAFGFLIEMLWFSFIVLPLIFIGAMMAAKLAMLMTADRFEDFHEPKLFFGLLTLFSSMMGMVAGAFIGFAPLTYWEQIKSALKPVRSSRKDSDRIEPKL